MRKESNKNKILSAEQRSILIDFIRHREDDPTFDEEVDFNESDDFSESDEQPVGKTSLRGPSNSEKFKRHLDKNWINYVIGLVVFIGSFFVYQAKVDLAVQGTEIGNLKEDVNQNESQIEFLEKETTQNNYEIKSILEDLNSFEKDQRK